ncbi:hypothetical protein LTR86_000160 [Recurvomyces mirabilis]|nr:hypothetical protein LTR86_000160 [Recurvomyces mirabilis]
MADDEQGLYPFTHTIEVLVGEQQTKFTVHPHVLTSRSPFFDAALRRWKEAGEPVVLADEFPEVFNKYMSGVYRGTLVGLESEEGQIATEDLFQIYVLADKLGDVNLANEAIDYLKCQLNLGERPDHLVVFRAWSATVENSGLHRLLVDFYSSRSDVEEVCAELQSGATPKDLLRVLAQAFKRNCYESEARREECNTTIWSPDTPACAYHQHDDLHPRSNRCGLPSSPVYEDQHEAESEPNPEFGLFD